MRRSVMSGLVIALVLGGAATVLARGPANASSTSSTVAAKSSAAELPSPVCIRAASSSSSASVTAPLVCHAWRHVDNWFHTLPTVLTTSFAPNEAVPTVVAYAAWIRTSTTDLALYPGVKGPGPSTFNRGPLAVPTSGYARLLATFNSGFYEADGAAGFYAHTTLYDPMINGLATVVRYSNGQVNITKWIAGARPGPTIVMARQNLSLLVNNYKPTPASRDNQLWGDTLGGVQAVWRTALGIDVNGNLIYVAAPEQTSASLAQIMVQLHVVRAMQLDINPEWPIFVSYGAAGARGATLFVPNPNQVPTRFLFPSTKDFFAVFISRRAGEPQPW
jgi:hypothetical protein